MKPPRGRAGWSVPLAFLAVVFFCQAGTISPAQSLSGGPLVDAFFVAIQENNTNAVFKLLDKNTNLVHASYYGRLPLHVAAQKGCVGIVARLLHDGVDINEENDSLDTSNSHLTALDIAIWYNQPEVVRLLIESGANPNLLGSHDGGALHFAFLYGRREMVSWLLAHGANPFLENQFTYNHATPIDLAIDHGQGKLVPQMLGLMARFDTAEARTNPPPSRFNLNRTPIKAASAVFAERGAGWLSAAAQHGELEAVEALLEAGVTVKAASTNCPTLLQSFALAANEASRSLPATREQWQQAQERLKADYLPRADPSFVANLRAQEAELENRVGLLAPERWQKILELLIQQGAEFDAFAATALGDSNRVEQLLVTDKSVLLARDCTGRTPLHWSVQTDRLPMASLWIAAGISVDATNQSGQTALHLAATAGKAAFVQMLLAAHASTSIRNTNGLTALDAASQSKQADCIRLLLPQTAGSHPERGLSISLHQAAATGNLAALAALLETRPNLEARNELGLTPLQVAVHDGHLAAAALLVDKGANINARDPEGNTMLLQTIPRFFGFFMHDRPPTHWLDRLGDDPRKPDYLKYLTVGQHEQGPSVILQAVTFLLAAGIDVKATNHAGQNAIQLAMNDDTTLFDDREPLIKLLQGAGATVEQRDAEGNTALHRAIHAVDANELDALAAIIAAGADVNATNAAGKTPLHLAAAQIMGWDEDAERACEPFQCLIKAKADVNTVDNEGQTPLEVLAAADTSFKPEATRALLDAGADPKHRDKQGRTAAHLFLSGEWPWGDAGPCLDMLVQAGADLNARDDEGKTPLHYLAGLGDQKPMFFIHGIDGLFVKAKVDFNARDNDGDTPLHIAARTGTRDVFDWLVKKGAGLDETNNIGQTPRSIQRTRPAGRQTIF